MIAALAAAVVGAAPLAPDAVVARYRAALATLAEPRTFSVEYTMVQTGTRTLEQTHRIFRRGGDERDETLAVNGTRSTVPVIRIFHGRPYRYRVAALAPRPDAYAFAYAGPHRDGHHLDYVFRLTPKSPSRGFRVMQVTIDGLTFLPDAIAFTTAEHGGRGTVTFRKADRWWVASGASATARLAGGLAHEQIAFSRWRFPASLPSSTFALPRPLATAAPELP